MPDRYPAPALVSLGRELLTKVGVDADKAQVVAEILVEGDLLGHTTHGLALLPAYLKAAEEGSMTRSGDPRVISDFPAAVAWDGMRLPGPWLTVRALELASTRAKQNGLCGISIRRSHHIGCLAAYGQRVAEKGLVMFLTCSDPSVRGVAPYGGKREVMTPNPIAAAWPTKGDPVVIDVSMSITSLAMARRTGAAKQRLPGKWLVDGAGEATDDPAVLSANPPGALLPIGGLDHGHKGYALGLLVETLTGGLAGFGRADPAEGWSATIFVQVINPAMFGGTDEFLRQTTFLADACRQTPPRPGVERVRLPGEAGFARRRRQLEDGIELHPSVIPALKPWIEKLHVPAPGIA